MGELDPTMPVSEAPIAALRTATDEVQQDLRQSSSEPFKALDQRFYDVLLAPAARVH